MLQERSKGTPNVIQVNFLRNRVLECNNTEVKFTHCEDNTSVSIIC
jgi:hypothetical protein